ncbi:MAG TPA: SAF domain-containing protein, partial [Solirubrobacteraceae bacterium]|nr:SAF domain-containing protein [Solirubrobacteraceae bacterium]
PRRRRARAGVSPRRRAAVLLGLALLLGALAASDVAGREAALRRELGPPVPVVVVRRAISPGGRIGARDLAVRRVPARYAPAGAYADPVQAIGLRAAAALPAGADLTAAATADAAAAPGARVARGERVAEVLATGSADAIGPGTRVDVVVTRDGHGAAPGATSLALEDVEVVSAAPAPPPAGDEPGPRLAVGLRVTLRQAVFLAAAQAFAREVRVLARAPGDRRRAAGGVAFDERLAPAPAR